MEHTLVWNVAEELVQGVLEIAGKNSQKLVEFSRFAKKHSSLSGFQRLQCTQRPDAPVSQQDLHVEQVLLGQLVLQRGGQLAVRRRNVRKLLRSALPMLVRQLSEGLAAPGITTMAVMLGVMHRPATLWKRRKAAEAKGGEDGSLWPHGQRA